MKDELQRHSQQDSDATSSCSDDEWSEASTSPMSQDGVGTGVWTKEEHTKFLEAIEIYPDGPWKLVTAYVGTRTVRQTMTHAQKYRQKTARRLRGLRTKQALMRMHIGHHVSEESLVQERRRAIANSQQLSRESLFSTERSVYRSSHAQASRFENGADTYRTLDNRAASTPCELMIDPLEDLDATPSLEECAAELLNILF